MDRLHVYYIHFYCIYLQLEIQSDITLTNHHYLTDCMSTLLFDADDADAAKFHPKVDANGNCETDDKVSPPWLFFLNIFEYSCGLTEKT